MAHADRSTSAAVLHDSRAEVSYARRQLEGAVTKLRVTEVVHSITAEEAAVAQQAATAAGVEVVALRVRICPK